MAFPTEPYRCAAREAQATILREFVDYYQYYGIEVIVLGDFNDFDGEIPDVAGNVPTSKVSRSLLHGETWPYVWYRFWTSSKA